MVNTKTMYAKTEEHAANNARFVELLAAYPNITAFQPSPKKAPWHWQIKLAFADSNTLPYELNIWPHVAKACFNGSKAEKGWPNIKRMFEEAITMWVEDLCNERT